MSRPIGPQIKVSMHPVIVDEIDALALRASQTRSEWVRDAVAKALGAATYGNLTEPPATPTATSETASD